MALVKEPIKAPVLFAVQIGCHRQLLSSKPNRAPGAVTPSSSTPVQEAGMAAYFFIPTAFGLDVFKIAQIALGVKYIVEFC